MLPAYMGKIAREILETIIDDTLEIRFGYLGKEFIPEESPSAENLLSRPVRFGPMKNGVTIDLGKVVEHAEMFQKEGLPIVITAERNVNRGSMHDGKYGDSLGKMLADKYGEAKYLHLSHDVAEEKRNANGTWKLEGEEIRAELTVFKKRSQVTHYGFYDSEKISFETTSAAGQQR